MMSKLEQHCRDRVAALEAEAKAADAEHVPDEAITLQYLAREMRKLADFAAAASACVGPDGLDTWAGVMAGESDLQSAPDSGADSGQRPACGAANGDLQPDPEADEPTVPSQRYREHPVDVCRACRLPMHGLAMCRRPECPHARLRKEDAR